MCKQLSLKKLKKIHELEQEDLKAKLKIGIEFLGGVFESGASILAAKRANNVESTNPPDEPITVVPDLRKEKDAKACVSLINQHFKNRDGWFTCVGKNIDLIINDDALYFAAKNDPNGFSCKISHIQLVDFANLESYIAFVLNA
jgi:hypothetical protein